MMEQVEKSWLSAQLESLFIHVVGGDWGKDEDFIDDGYETVSCIRGSEFKSWKKELGATAVTRKVKSSSLETRKLADGDLLIEISGGGPDQPVGRTVLITDQVLAQLSYPAVCTNFLRLARPSNSINSAYLNYYLTKFYHSGEVVNYQGGSNNLRNLKFKEYSKIEIPVIPLAEQKVIADKLDALLAQVDTTKARLERIPKILKTFRQSVLAAAVSGRLTEEWRGSPPLDINTPSMTIGSESVITLTGWSWRKLTDLALLESGHTPRKSMAEYWENGNVYWLSLQDIREAHGRVINDTKFKPTMLGIENSSARLLPEGTVCFCRDISVGYVTIMGKSMSTTQHFANWICGKELNNKFLMYSFMAAKDHLLISGQGTTVKTIYMPALKELQILTPTIDEQTEIVRRVEELFAFADTIEQKAAAALDRVNNLTQSILAKAFRGELTADWRAANPELIRGENSAEALLKKIKAEREALASQKQTKKKTLATATKQA